MLEYYAGNVGSRLQSGNAAAERGSKAATSPRPATDRVRRTLSDVIDDVHQRLHVTAVFAAIAEGTVSWADYIGLLQSLCRFHLATAASLERGHQLLGAVAFHDRSVLLRDDLAALGVQAPTGGETLALTDAEKVGLVYAVEGSLLGAKVINRQLGSLFGGQLDGRRFFATEADPRDRWARVCNALEQYGAEPARLEGMCRGAVASFTFMEECLGS